MTVHRFNRANFKRSVLSASSSALYFLAFPRASLPSATAFAFGVFIPLILDYMSGYVNRNRNLISIRPPPPTLPILPGTPPIPQPYKVTAKAPRRAKSPKA